MFLFLKSIISDNLPPLYDYSTLSTNILIPPKMTWPQKILEVLSGPPPPHFLGVDDAMETSWLYLSRIFFDFSLKPVYPTILTILLINSFKFIVFRLSENTFASHKIESLSPASPRKHSFPGSYHTHRQRKLTQSSPPRK